VTSASLPISIAKAAGEIFGNSSNYILSWLSCHKDFEQSFVPASKSELAKKTAPIWKFFTLIHAPLDDISLSSWETDKKIVLATAAVQ
jgi:hypothetical protein